MTQTVIVYLILTAAALYTLYAVIRSIRRKPQSDCESGCDGCTGCDIKNELTKNVDKTNVKHSHSCH